MEAYDVGATFVAHEVELNDYNGSVFVADNVVFDLFVAFAAFLIYGDVNVAVALICLPTHVDIGSFLAVADNGMVGIASQCVLDEVVGDLHFSDAGYVFHKILRHGRDVVGIDRAEGMVVGECPDGILNEMGIEAIGFGVAEYIDEGSVELTGKDVFDAFVRAGGMAIAAEGLENYAFFLFGVEGDDLVAEQYEGLTPDARIFGPEQHAGQNGDDHGIRAVVGELEGKALVAVAAI